MGVSNPFESHHGYVVSRIPQLLLVAYGEHRDNGLFRCVRGKADLLLVAVAGREVNNELMLMLELLIVMGHVWVWFGRTTGV